MNAKLAGNLPLIGVLFGEKSLIGPMRGGSQKRREMKVIYFVKFWRK